ncbi:hypothetical protein MUN89_05515 [Halobacillus salinarum]|uniref:Uncharacterized protein n=1 Tax=Halobacillus salinarum TaxID=2932257 RepID=A0ABY4ELZ2_9BACI|nr:hypothetical protein [Halobacillus salinarum]UOQ45405.1 hypothetical protein MUN89_05515 [Halobacillus salinarum]
MNGNEVNELKLYCRHCQKYFQADDQVALNEMNTVLHMDCPDEEGLLIKDEGTFREIMEKYQFFDNVLIQ